MHPGGIEGVQTVCIGTDTFSIKKGKALFFTRVPRVRRLLNQFKPDVVVGPYLISNGLTAAMAWRGPLIVSSQGTDGVERLCEQGFPRWLARRMIRWTCNRADLVHAVSPQWQREVLRLGIPEQKTFVVPLGIDTRVFTPPSQPPNNDPIHIVCIRKHEPVYRINVIINALAALTARGICYRATFAATGTLLDEHKQLAERLNLTNQVTFTGDMPQGQVVDLLRAADIYVSASVSDGTASSLLEAMSVGAFPVVSRIEANVDWIADGETGLLFDTDDVDSTVDALTRAANNPELRRKGVSLNRERVVAEADYEVTMGRLIGRIEDVVSRTTAASDG